jgi:beta-mannosidase
VNDVKWLPATVPGTVHTDLLANKKIEDPFYRTNESDQQWIEKEDWEYKTNFDVNQSLLANQHVDLVFSGLDTYADVYLNGEKILVANNMHRQWKVEVKRFLKLGLNELQVYFHSPINSVLQQFHSLGYTVPVSSNDFGKQRLSVYTRKAGYHYGWDWGPRFVSSGIWRPVYLQAWNRVEIEHLFIKQLSLSENNAELEARLSVNSTEEGVKQLNLFVENSPTPILSKTVWVAKGQTEVNARFLMRNVELWWPNGMGNHKLYLFRAELKDSDKLICSKSVKHGMRTIEVVEESDEKGKSFYFKVNGKAVFVKGANYIPQDNFLTRVTTEHYQRIINTAVESNMNMLRVWGGGIYENDIFYDLCDENGLMVWQDFMFACALFPPFDDLKANIYEEAVYNVKRLRNHPSIALWCGNNEIAQFMNQDYWGHLKSDFRTKDDSLTLQRTYMSLFHEILPAVVKAYDENRFYWSTSANDQNYQSKFNGGIVSGDFHYYGVWGGKPIEEYNNNVGRFMSEYGFQSFPELETVKEFAKPEDFNLNSAVMKAHQKSQNGNTKIANYMKDNFKTPSKFEDFLYVGQLLQSEAIRTAVEAHRRNMPVCMGTLYWQLNDCWPVASWSAMDYYGRWKAAQYMLKKAFQPFMLSVYKQEESIKIYAVSEMSNPTDASLKISLIDFSGKVIHSETNKVTLSPNTSSVQYQLKENEWLTGVDRHTVVLHVQLTTENNKVLAENNYFFEKSKDLILPSKPQIKIKKIDASHIEVSTEKLARFVWLNIPNAINPFSDNYFDLLPGEKKLLQVNAPLDMKVIKIMSLADVN